jgi:hypothetical protein
MSVDHPILLKMGTNNYNHFITLRMCVDHPVPLRIWLVGYPPLALRMGVDHPIMTQLRMDDDHIVKGFS